MDREPRLREGPTVKNKVVFRIGGIDYSIVADESEEYMRKVAELVDARMKAVNPEGRLPLHISAVLTAVNLGDDYFKARQDAENLRGQIKGFLDENAKLRAQLAEVRRSK